VSFPKNTERSERQSMKEWADDLAKKVLEDRAM
jgi:hypothetical protein